MPVPPRLEPDVVRDRLDRWLRDRLPEGNRLRLTGMEIPVSRGFAGETLMITLEGAGDRSLRLVVRTAPTRHQVYPDDRFADQVRLIRLLARRTAVPVPDVEFFEPDGTVLGAPFSVMPYVDGQVPSDLPSYHRSGWLAELAPSRRADLWWSALAAMAAVHRLDTPALGLDFIDRPEYGVAGVSQQLGYYEAHLAFFGCADASVPLAALDWLKANRPPEPATPGLLWGDARIGNMIFRDLVPVAVIDWEMAALGPAEIDLGWFLWMDRFLSEGIGASRLAGLPDRVRTLARYENLLGRPLRAPGYYELLAGLRFALITARVQRLMDETGMLPPGVSVPLHANATRLLERALAGQVEHGSMAS